MTRLLQRKTRLRFETEAVVRGNRLVVEATPHTASLREKGKRKAFDASWEAIYWLAAKIAADAQRRERKAARRH